MKKYLLFFSIILLLSSCGDCFQIIKGQIIDEQTKLPIEGVIITKKGKESIRTTSDKNGKFELDDISGGTECTMMTAVFRKNNYQLLEFNIESGDSVNVSLKPNPVDKSYNFKKLEAILKEYINSDESVDSDENKNIVKAILTTLEKVEHFEDYNILLNLWHYYDPTDFPVRTFILPLLLKDKQQSINAINKRIQNKSNWETEDTLEFSFLIQQLEKNP